jgi:hypothetical protein
MSAACLLTWSGWPDLNRRPLRPEAIPADMPWSGQSRTGAIGPHLRKRSEWVALSQPVPEHVGPVLAPVAPQAGEGLPMPIKVDEDFMCLEVDGTILATARKRVGGLREVSHWPRFFDRNQAITALTITELLEGGHDSDDPVVRALRDATGHGHPRSWPPL